MSVTYLYQCLSERFGMNEYRMLAQSSVREPLSPEGDISPKLCRVMVS